MGEHTAPKFPQEIIDEYAALGVDLPALFSAGHLGERMGVQIVEASADRVVGTMPVEGNTQPYGLLHGGASAVLAETLGSVGSMLHGGATKLAVGVDLNCTHHRGARSGLVTGVATPYTAAAPPPRTRSSSRTNRTSASAPHASPACSATPPSPQPPDAPALHHPSARPGSQTRPGRAISTHNHPHSRGR